MNADYKRLQTGKLNRNSRRQPDQPTLVVITRALVMLVVENNIEKRTVDYQPTVVMNETQLSEFVHEEIDP